MFEMDFKTVGKYLMAGLLVFALSSFLLSTDCYADATFGSLTKAGTEIFGGMRKIIFASAGFGIIAVALGAIFGALNWKWLAAIIIGVVVIALTGGLLAYMTAGTKADTDSGTKGRA